MDAIGIEEKKKKKRPVLLDDILKTLTLQTSSVHIEESMSEKCKCNIAEDDK